MLENKAKLICLNYYKTITQRDSIIWFFDEKTFRDRGSGLVVKWERLC